MLNTTLTLLLSLAFLTSCSLYSSAGRKQFEDKAPAAAVVQSYTLLSCRELGSAEMWLKEEFPSRGQELLDMHPDFEVWGKTQSSQKYEVTVFTKIDPDATESCLYEFESKNTWTTNRKKFLSEIADSLTNLD